MIDRYGAPEEDTLAYMEKIGRARGYLLRGGLIDYEKPDNCFWMNFEEVYGAALRSRRHEMGCVTGI